MPCGQKLPPLRPPTCQRTIRRTAGNLFQSSGGSRPATSQKSPTSLPGGPTILPGVEAISGQRHAAARPAVEAIRTTHPPRVIVPIVRGQAAAPILGLAEAIARSGSERGLVLGLV